MNLRINIFLSLLILIFLPSVLLAETCTREQALNRMMALDRAANNTTFKGEKGDHLHTSLDLMREKAAVGDILGEGRYDEACDLYKKIADNYGIDLEEAAKGMKTISELERDYEEAKKSGKCTQADGSAIIMEYFARIEDRNAQGEDLSHTREMLIAEHEKLQDLIYTNPEAYCAGIRSFGEKEGL